MPPSFPAFRERVRRHGMTRALFACGMKTANRILQFRILRGLCIEQPREAFLRCPAPFSAGFASPCELRAFAGEPANELPAQFVERALARGDRCFAIREGDTLAAYSWYARRPTHIDLPEVLLHFRPGWTYMYKAFTHPRYRGRRLYSYGVSLALRHYLACGSSGLLAYVESTNFDSLRSSARTGLRPFGSIVVAGAGGRVRAVSSPGCARLGFRLEPCVFT